MELIAVLEDIRSVHNVGSIFRTADAAGFSKIYCCGITPGPLDRFKSVRPDFAKVSLGAENSVAWERKKSIGETLAALKNEGYLVVAAEQAKDSIPYFQAKPKGEKIAIVVGNEVDGVSAEALKLTDQILEIPMRGKKESLNVAVAFGIIAFSLINRM